MSPCTTLWHRLLRRSASEYGTLCHGHGRHVAYPHPLGAVHNHFFLTAPPLRSELPGQSTFGGCHWRTGFWSVASSPVDSGVCAPGIPLTPGGRGGRWLMCAVAWAPGGFARDG